MKKGDIEYSPLNLPGGGKCVIGWSRSLWLDGADARRPLRLEVTVAVGHPDATGMPEGGEVDYLDGIRFRLVRAVTRKAKGVHAMTVTGASQLVFVFYLPEAAGVVKKRDPRELLPPVIAGIADQVDRELTLEWFDDPDWTRLIGIYPQHDPAQWGLDRSMLVHMAKAGDAINARRTVAHRIYFAERTQCPGFLRDARKLRLKADGGPKKAKVDAPGAVVVVVERLEPTIATWHLHPVVLEIKALVAQHGGVYDGWETELIPSLVPPPLTGPKPTM